MLINSAVAIFFSCSGATGFSEIEFDSESSVCYPTTAVRDFFSRLPFDTAIQTGFSIGRMKPLKVKSRLPSWEGSYRF